MPVLANLEAELILTEGDGPTLIDSDVDVSDSEQDWNGGQLTVGGMASSDIVSLLDGGQITLDVFDIIHGGQVVGVWSIGPGGEFIVTFNANATNAAVEAVIESLQFEAPGDNPDFFRNLTLDLTDAAGNPASVGSALFPPGSDPFNGVDFGDSTVHVAVGDIDNDGDLDVIASMYDDGFHLLRNDGTAAAPNFVQADAALTLPVTGNAAGITLADVDGDGFQDLVVGRYGGGAIDFFKGDGAFGFTQLTGAANPFNGLSVYSSASPGLADLNGDGFLDLVVGNGGGRWEYFAGGASGFTELTDAANPFDGYQSFGGGASVSFADADGDGDLDMISNGGEFPARVFENTGTASAPVFTPWLDSPFETHGMGHQPVWADLDADGDIDQIEAGRGQVFAFLLGPASPSIEVFVDGIDDVATVNNETPAGAADGAIVVDLLSNDSDVDTPLMIVMAEIDGQPVVIDDITTLADGTRFTILSDGTVTLDPGRVARQLGDSNSGAANTSLQYVVTYTLWGGETGTATFTVNGVDDADFLEGTGTGEEINGGVGNDIIYGRGGGDELNGEAGNDSLFGGLDGDSLFGGDGADKLYGEGAGDYLEGGAGADYLYGGDAGDALYGNADNDYLDGGAGEDYMAGGLGNDVYIVDDLNDVVVEASGGGTDIIRSFVDIAAMSANVEALQLQGSDDLDGVGNALANNMQGNSGANRLEGGQGADTINGADGDDVIIGGEANDLLRGGLGADTFLVAHTVGSSLETDIIYDFDAGEGDILDLSGLYAGTLSVVGAFSKTAGQMTLGFAAGQTTVKVDLNGDGRVDWQVKINGDVTGETGDWLL